MNTDFLTALKNSPVSHLNQHLLTNVDKKKPRAPRRPSKHVEWISSQLSEWGAKNGLKIENEYKFHEFRKWRFDFYLPELNTAIEYEGLMSKKSRHTTVNGFSGDTEKYSQAAILGIIVLRYTALNYKNVIRDLENVKSSKV